MIISGAEKRSTKSRFSNSLWVKIGLTTLVLAGIVWAIIAYVQQENRVFPGKVVCDAENVEGKYFITDGIKFKGGTSQSKDWAFTGNYSCKVWKKRKYGITYSVYNPKPGERYKARVWVHRPKGTGGILVAAAPDNAIRTEAREPKQKHVEWELFEAVLDVPGNFKQNRLDFYVYTDEETLYFDDFTVERIKVEPTNYDLKVLNLDIADKWMDKIKAKRKAAMDLGILISADDDWVEGEIDENGKKIDVELRLKGDWLDHLRTDKWSYRIKVGGENSWNRMRTFSIQQPEARNFLDEWVFHKFLEKVDVLTPRYDFVEVIQNGVSKGIYAYEEHFDKQLVEYKKRREGPIVRFREDLAWLNVRREMEMYANDEGIYNRQFTNAEQSGQIAPFKEGKTKKSATLAQQFEQAQKLMQQYRHGTKPVEDIFDIDLMARHYAVVDLMNAYHGIAWHNQRYYYNPVTSKLEPIGFDGFSGGHEMGLWRNEARFIGEGTFNEEYDGPGLLTPLFKNEKFMEKYTEYLYLYSSREYFEAFIESLEDEIIAYENMLKIEYPKAKFDFQKFHKVARNIRAVVEPYAEHAVQAHTESETAKIKKLKVTNFHALPMRVLGFGKNMTTIMDSVSNPTLLQCNLKNQPPTYLEMTTKPGMKHIFYELPGKDSVYTSTISVWKAPIGETALQQIFNYPTLENTEAYRVIDKTVIFIPGKFTITKDIIIPEGYRVVFSEGVELNFIKKAKFISKSPVIMIGTENQPITIKSTDFSANGFTVLQAKDVSKMAYVTFEGFNTVATNGWNLTGAVTFYESDINIKKCRFIKNKCEDGLNIVRAKLDIDGITIGETFSDGLDIDFGTGIIKNAYFYKTGNDGMDFSGSQLTIENAIIKKAGDKGISVGEESSVYAKDVEINGANIGIASKDLSKLVVEFLSIKDCNQGIIAFQKKPEYGGAKIVINNYKAENIRFLHKIQEGSSLQLKGEEVDNS